MMHRPTLRRRTDWLKGLGLNFLLGSLACVGSLLGMAPAGSQAPPVTPADSSPTETETTPVPNSGELDLPPEIIEQSPVLQRWQRQIPNVLEEIRNDPSFRTRVRLGYSQFPSSDNASGFNVGVEDVFIGGSRLTVSADYQGSGNGDRSGAGAELRYYALPLGNYVNIAPVVGYRHLETESYSTTGLQLGARLMLIPSRTGSADLSLGYSVVGIGGDETVGLTTFSVGYALTRNLRLAADLQRQDAEKDNDNRVGIVLEFMP